MGKTTEKRIREMSNSRIKQRERYRLKCREEEAEFIKWEDVYQLPLHPDKHGSYAWSKNGTMSLMFEYEYMDCLGKKVIKCINGERESDSKGRWYKDGVDFFLDGKYIFCVRGWGHLTGTGAMNLPLKSAERIQDGFIEYCFKRLNG